MKTLLDVKTRLLKNKATREAYLALEEEFSVAHEVITVRAKTALQIVNPHPKKLGDQTTQIVRVKHRT